VKINFQQTGGDVPEGYLPDGGEVFGDRGNRYSYGWNMDSTGGARNRNNADAPDERYDTTQHLEKGEHRIWEIELPNGTYDLLVACGDANHTDQINNMDVEGTVLLDPDGEDNYDEYELTVEVTDGRLIIQMAEGASNAKIMFVDIAQAVPAVNILANGGFEDGVPDPWSTYGDASLEVVQDDPVEGDNCLHVTVNSAGANFWDAGLQHAGHVFEPGKSYTLSAYLKAKEGTMDINFKPELGADPWTGYGSQAFTMTDVWTEFTVNTGEIPEVVDPATITFHIAYTAGEFYIDDVRFTED
jgi:hypothetical protein